MKTLWAIPATLALLAAACGSDASDEVSAAPEVVSVGAGGDSTTDDGDTGQDEEAGATDEEVALEFAACMRDEGVDMEDPTVNADGSVNLFGGAGPGTGGARGQEDFQEAFETCGEVLEGATFFGNRADNAEFEDNLLEFAQCLRDNGVDVDDPNFNSEGGAQGGGFLFGDDFDPRDPANAEVMETCQGLFGGFRGGQQGGD